jgi:hypothetical protein
MSRRPGFALLLLASVIFLSRFASSQEATANKPSENGAADKGTADSSSRSSKTHCDIPSCVQKILYLSNISQPTDLQDTVNAIRVIGDLQRVQQVFGSSIIIVEGTAEQVAIAEKLAAAIDKDKRRFGGLGYRIELKIQESEGEKKSRSRLYSFVTEAHQAATVGIKRRAPAPVSKDAAADAKPPADYSNSRSIECRILAENEHTLELSVEAEFASDPTSDPGTGTSPLLRIRENVTVELDRPTVVSRIDDPDSDRTFTIELTATRIKDRS